MASMLRVVAVTCGLMFAWSGWCAPSEVPAPPAQVEITDEEAAQLADGDILISLDSTGDSGAQTLAILDVAAPPDVVLAAVMDVEARVDEVGSVKDVSRYHEDKARLPEELGIRWELKVVGRTVVFHTFYWVQPDAGWATYVMDTDQDNDLKSVAGSYYAYSNGTGSRLVYRSETETGVSVPNWIRKILVGGSLKDQLGGIRARAEAASATASM